MYSLTATLTLLLQSPCHAVRVSSNFGSFSANLLLHFSSYSNHSIVVITDWHYFICHRLTCEMIGMNIFFQIYCLGVMKITLLK